MTRQGSSAVRVHMRGATVARDDDSVMVFGEERLLLYDANKRWNNQEAQTQHHLHGELNMCEATDNAANAVPAPAKKAGRCFRIFGALGI